MSTDSMGTATAVRPPASTAGLGGTPFAGTTALWRFGLRRERIPLLAWGLGIPVVTASTLSAFAGLYPDAAGRAGFAAGLATNPAFTVLTGPVFDSSLGGLTAWRMALLGSVLASLMSIFTVIRRTRTDEEAGRTELLASAAVGRVAPLAAALGCAVAGCVAIFALVTVALAAQGESLAGSLALGGAIAGPALVFAGVAAVTAQLFDSARASLGLAGLALGVAFGIRAAADAGGPGIQWLRWVSPLGWAEEVRAFAANRSWVLLLMVVAAAALVFLSLQLLGRRDVGLGMFPARLGDACGSLHSPLALAARLQRGTAVGWTLALAVFGAVIGAIVDSAQNLFGDNAQMTEIVRQIGGPGAISDALLAGLGGMAGILATIAAVSAAGRMVTEEQSERSSLILSAGVGRTRWQAGHLLFVAAVPVLMLAAAGVTAGILHGARSGDFGAGFTDALTAMLAQLPAVWVVASVAVLLQGWAPQLWPGAWVVLVVAVLIGQLGPVLQLPQFVQDISPFTHLGSVLTSGVPWGAVAILIALTTALTGAAVAGFRRRDLTSR